MSEEHFVFVSREFVCGDELFQIGQGDFGTSSRQFGSLDIVFFERTFGLSLRAQGGAKEGGWALRAARGSEQQQERQKTTACFVTE